MEFGKLSRQELREFYAYYYQSRLDLSEFAELRVQNVEKLRDYIASSGSWACLYDLPERTIVLLFLAAVNLLDAVISACRVANPHQGLLDFLSDDPEPGLGLSEEDISKAAVLFMPMMGNFEAREQYGQSLNSLLVDAASGSDEALLKAVRVDRTCLGSEVVSERICLAQAISDESFMNLLAKSVTRAKPIRPKPHLDEARFLLTIIDESIGLTNLTYETVQ